MLKRSIPFIFILAGVLFLYSCSPQQTPFPRSTSTPEIAILPTEVPEETIPMSEKQFADVLSVNVSGESGAYQFAVEVSSPDTGCEQYADWWEVFSEDEQLLYRRVLLHSHVGEQPFVRSGGPVDISADTFVYVRAHMNTVGYGGLLMTGTVRNGFKPASSPAGFGSGLERMSPQPEDCAF